MMPTYHADSATCETAQADMCRKLKSTKFSRQPKWSPCISTKTIKCDSHSLEKLVKVEVEVLCLAAVEVEPAAVAAVHVVLLSLLRV